MLLVLVLLGRPGGRLLLLRRLLVRLLWRAPGGGRAMRLSRAVEERANLGDAARAILLLLRVSGARGHQGGQGRVGVVMGREHVR